MCSSLHQLIIAGVALGACSSPLLGQEAARATERLREERREHALQGQIETMQENRNEGIAGGVGKEEKPEYSEGDKVPVLFLKKVTIDQSSAIADADWRKITSPYENKKVSIADIKDMLAAMNTLYQKKGYITCRAYLPEQDISSGTLHIALFEGKVGNVEIKEAKSTRPGYVEKSLQIHKGDVFNRNDMEENLIRSNSSNNSKARLAIAPGDEDTMTTLDLIVNDENRFSGLMFTDNAGQESTGYYRGGIVATARRLAPCHYIRDFATVGGIFSEGSTAAFGSYTLTESTWGTAWTAGMDWSDTDMVNGDMSMLDIKGNFYNYNLGVKKFILTTKNNVASLNLTGNYKKGETDLSSVRIQETRTKLLTLGVDDLWLFNKGYFYGSLSVSRGWRNDDYLASSDEDGGKIPLNFWRGNFTSEIQYGFSQLLGVNSKMRAQLCNVNNLPSSEQMQLGGVTSVRGYAEGMISGEQGISWSTELKINLESLFTRWQKVVKKSELFLFYDCGRLDYGSGGAVAALNEKFIDSTGLGLRVTITDYVQASCTATFPLRTHPGNEHGRGCHWLVNVTASF